MVRCAITDTVHVDRDPHAQRRALLESAQRWSAEGVELVQLRQKHLEAGALLQLAEEMLAVIRSRTGSRTKLVVNGRADVAVAAAADGVHLTSHAGELTPEQVRCLFAYAGLAAPVVSISCHTLDDVARARQEHADYILFGPVFEKRSGGELIAPGSGLELLAAACKQADRVPVLALGGITSENTPACLESGAAGVAGIRLFHCES
ncbi:MAG TPA: thiamine phosphate synthase [Acidobacteriaceae bacterium]|nr:thiamine phosphate synthase [Acidobacteriaceae bacterium]